MKLFDLFRSRTASHLKIGKLGEKAAVKLYKKRNAVILARNWRNSNAHDGMGELDIVLMDGETLVFAEVKTRSKLDEYLPGANLSDSQKKRIRRGAQAYIKKHRIPESIPIRFDMAEVIHDGSKLLDISLHEKYMTFSTKLNPTNYDN